MQSSSLPPQLLPPRKQGKLAFQARASLRKTDALHPGNPSYQTAMGKEVLLSKTPLQAMYSISFLPFALITRDTSMTEDEPPAHKAWKSLRLEPHQMGDPL